MRLQLLCAALAFAVSSAAVAQDPAGIRAAFRADPLPIDAGDPAWGAAPELAVQLLPQMMIPPHGGGSVTTVSVRALHDGGELALRLEWADPTESREVGVHTFRDAVAVGFPIRGEMLPAPFMGDAEHPVDIWQWTADFDANASGRSGFSERYPHTEGVWYFPHDYAVTRQVRGWRGTEPVIEFVATGWGTLTRKVTQNVTGLGVHEKGRWRVVLRRGLGTGSPEDATFRAGERTFVILAVWDGGQAEVNGKKAVTMQWTPLLLESTVKQEHGE